jgi:hypothetical protein
MPAEVTQPAPGQTRATRRAVYAACEADVKATVRDRDPACVVCGAGDPLTVQHVIPRGMGGTSIPIDPRLAIVLCGSGTTGCHGMVESAGRRDGWAYELGYLIRHDAELDAVRGDPDRSRLVWFHRDRAWMELFVSGVRTARPGLPQPPRLVLHAVDTYLHRRGLG